MIDKLNWDDLKTLIAVAEAGSLSGAAARTGLSQPTLGRRIDMLEQALSLHLFDRSPRGLVPTPSCIDILAHAREMQAAAARLSLAATGRSGAVAGTVRLTAPMVISHFHLPDILTRLIDAAPGVEIALVPSDSPQNLLLREADIAIRTFRPAQDRLIARKVADLPLGLYAARDYVARHDMPTLATFDQHRMVGYDRNPLIRDVMTGMGIEAAPDFFRIRTDDQAAYWHLVVAGAGIGGNQRSVGDAEPRVVRVLPDLDLPVLPVWLTCHEDLHTNKLIRKVYDFLGEALGQIGKDAWDDKN